MVDYLRNSIDEDERVWYKHPDPGEVATESIRTFTAVRDLRNKLKNQSELIETLQKKIFAWELKLQKQANFASDDSNSSPSLEKWTMI